MEDKVFCDIFAGTGVIGRTFKPLVGQVISNDLEYYSYVLNKNYIENCSCVSCDKLLYELNNLELIEGFVYKHYCLGGNSQRQYFSDTNAKKIDTIRTKIQEWKDSKFIDDDMFFFLLASLIESSDEVANTASIYGSFLKELKHSAKKELVLKPAIFKEFGQNNRVYNQDANKLIKSIHGDILYMDPPYNQRQYGANYHILNTIALYDEFEPKGKTGQRDYNKSKFCSIKAVLQAFEELIKLAKFKYIFVSYNNEGIMSNEDIKNIMQKYGDYSLETKQYKRLATEDRNHKTNSTIEFLHVVIKK